jgi:thiamine pyrophosphate-dependent acetolactate synthase large subunit-like protein
MMRGCDLVVDYLIKEQTPYIFGYAGHGAVGLLDGVCPPACRSRSTPSTGPGPMLLTVALANAFYDSSSMVAITGQVATNQFDSAALQEECRHHAGTR